jgi:hypothetical protein
MLDRGAVMHRAYGSASLAGRWCSPEGRVMAVGTVGSFDLAVPHKGQRTADALCGTRLRCGRQRLLVRHACHVRSVGGSAHAAGQPERENLHGLALGVRPAWALPATYYHSTRAIECTEELQQRFQNRHGSENEENEGRGDAKPSGI